MLLRIRPQKLRGSWLAIGLVHTAQALSTPLQAQVIWELVTKQQEQQNEILAPTPTPTPSGSNNKSIQPQPIVWEPLPSTKTNKIDNATAINWTPIPRNRSVGEGSVPNTKVVWEIIPDSDTPNSTAPISTLVTTTDSYSGNDREAPPAEVIAQEAAMPPRIVPEMPAPPPIQALNRSVAFGDDLVGPDIGWKVPNGFRWSERWFGDAAIAGHSWKGNNEDFFTRNNSNTVTVIHTNLKQSRHWSFGLNSSFRNIYEADNTGGASNGMREGFSSGFRLARQIGDTGGIAFGGENILQWDNKAKTDRNFYLMASKGWWLGRNGKSFPLLIANGGFRTGRYADNDDLKFACINSVKQGSEKNEAVNGHCWGPIGSLSLVFNEWLGAFVEYNGNRHGSALAAVSINANSGIPLRLTLGAMFGRKDELIPKTEKYSWVFQASLGF